MLPTRVKAHLARYQAENLCQTFSPFWECVKREIRFLRPLRFTNSGQSNPLLERLSREMNGEFPSFAPISPVSPQNRSKLDTMYHQPDRAPLEERRRFALALSRVWQGEGCCALRNADRNACVTRTKYASSQSQGIASTDHKPGRNCSLFQKAGVKCASGTAAAGCTILVGQVCSSACSLYYSPPVAAHQEQARLPLLERLTRGKQPHQQCMGRRRLAAPSNPSPPVVSN